MRAHLLIVLAISLTGFDHVRFYRNIAFDLQAKGY